MPDKDGNGGYRSHGTRCAGEIIMQPNDICGVGTAYGANLGGKYNICICLWNSKVFVELKFINIIINNN